MSSRSFFIGMVSSKKELSSRKELHTKKDLYEYFKKVTKKDPNINIETEDYVISLFCPDNKEIINDDNEQIALLLYGEIYNINGSRKEQLRYLIEEYCNKGLSFSKDINGSFSLLVIDRIKNMICIITDRLNTRKVFYSKSRGCNWISNSLFIHPLDEIELDFIGVASYLANGAIFNNRTILKGVSILEKASIHELIEERFKSRKYWTYELSNYYSNINEKELKAKLSNLLIESVKKRAQDNSEIFLSLSGGYDAAGILGILNKLNVPEVHCFSYANGIPKKNSDAFVSNEMIKLTKYENQIVKRYQDNLINSINCNAKLGQGRTNFCNEIDAFMEMSKKIDPQRKAALFVGDECFGWHCELELKSNTDVLNSVMIYDFSVLSWLANFINKEIYRNLYEGLSFDIKNIIDQTPFTGDYHDSKDYLYLNQRVSNFILPLREYIPGQFFTVRYPFFDNDILDFMSKVPSYLRWEKQLYIKTITEMFPEFFQFRRAEESIKEIDWERELVKNCSQIKEIVSLRSSKLDLLIPQKAILQILDDVVDSTLEDNRRIELQRLYATLPKSITTSKVAQKTKRLLVRNVVHPRVDKITFLKRALVLRQFLENIGIEKIY